MDLMVKSYSTEESDSGKGISYGCTFSAVPPVAFKDLHFGALAERAERLHTVPLYTLLYSLVSSQQATL